MDAEGNGVLVFLVALVPVLFLGAVLTELLLAAAPRRGKRPDVSFVPPPTPPTRKPAPAPQGLPGLAGSRAAFVAANVVLAAGSLACGAVGRATWAVGFALPAAALLFRSHYSAGQRKK